MIENKTTFCGCGYGKATHPWKGQEGLRVHVLDEDGCCRMVAVGGYAPTRFYECDFHDDGNMIKMVATGRGSMTEYTFRHQRMYAYHEESGVWSLPKDKGSINSIGDNW